MKLTQWLSCQSRLSTSHKHTSLSLSPTLFCWFMLFLCLSCSCLLGFCYFFLWPHTTVFRTYSSLCAQGALWQGWGTIWGRDSRIKPGLAPWKTNSSHLYYFSRAFSYTGRAFTLYVDNLCLISNILCDTYPVPTRNKSRSNTWGTPGVASKQKKEIKQESSSDLYSIIGL